jgi:hypothetical protein
MVVHRIGVALRKRRGICAARPSIVQNCALNLLRRIWAKSTKFAIHCRTWVSDESKQGPVQVTA